MKKVEIPSTMTDRTRIWLLRHGETYWNKEQRLHGHRNSELTRTGREQAINNGTKLKKLIADSPRFISSPLGRCRETATIIANAIGFDTRKIEYDDRVKELSFGNWEGQKVPDILSNDHEAYQLRKENRWDVPAPDGESYAMVAERLEDWLKDVKDQNLILVSHGCAGRILRGIYSQMQRDQIYTLDESHDAIYLLENETVTCVG